MVSITNWKLQFLERRGLESPTGRPLYTYKVTSDEFLDLESILKERLTAYLKIADLAKIAEKLEFFPALFVLYSAEWWRRNYDGTGFTWDPILKTIGAPSNGWNQFQRSECVTLGFQAWRLRLSDAHGLRFLGSIAFQGGLPMQLLGAARGNIGRLLSRALQLASSGATNAKEIQEWVQSLATDLPKTYRQTEVFVLLTEIVITVLGLKEKARLINSEGAIEKLDQCVPNWRDSFPLPVEDLQAKGLIEQLIRDVATKVDNNVKQLIVDRFLEQTQPGQWILRSDIVLPEYLDASAIGKLFEIDPQNLTRTLTLRFLRGGKIYDLALRKLAGYERYRIDRYPIENYDGLAAGEHTMALMTASGESSHKEISRGDSLENELPWLFDQNSESSQIYRFIKQGSGTIAGTEGMVSVPSHWTPILENGSSIELQGEMPALNRSIYSICGTVRIEDSEGSIYRLRTGQATATAEQFELHGSRLWETFLQPDRAFIGVPKLFHISEHGLEQNTQGPIGWRIQGRPLTTSSDKIVGPVIAIWPAQGEAKWRSRIVLLPKQASLNIEPGLNINSGSIRFSNWGIVAIHCETPGITVSGTVDGDCLVAQFRYQGSDNPPEWAELTMQWKGNLTEAKIKVPFPTKGIRALDTEGNQLTQGSLLSVDEAYQVRMIGFLGEDNQHAELRLRLHDGNNGQPVNEILLSVKANAGESRLEIRLLDYVTEIKRMLAGADGLEAHISVRLKLRSGEYLTLRIARYALEFEKHTASYEVGLPQNQIGQVSINDLKLITVCAVKINAPGEEPLRLLPSESEGVLTGKWVFPAPDLQLGPWLIYPGQDSKLSFRPMLWPVTSPESKTASKSITGEIDTVLTICTASDSPLPLKYALDISNKSERATALLSVIESIATDFIDDDWVLVEQMSGTLGHLPLSTLDLWRQITHSPSGMAAIAIRIGNLPANFVERFSTELPFVWESIPLTNWVGAIHALMAQGIAWYGGDASESLLAQHLDNRIQALSTFCPSLRILLEVARALATRKIKQELLVAQHASMDITFERQLFEGENSRVQRLLQINANSPNWPRGFGSQISSARNNGYGHYFCTSNFGFHDDVINTPIFMALNVLSEIPLEQGLESSEIETIRNMQSFDPEWFSEAFDLTIARCIATGAINLTFD